MAKTKNLPAAPAPAEGGEVANHESRMAALMSRFSVKKHVTLPTLNPGVDQPYVLRFDEAIRQSTYVDPDPKKAKEKPADIASVTDMETGAIYQLLVPAVLKANLEEQYPDGAYVGLMFAVMKLPKRPGKRYFDWNIVEVEATE